MDKKNGLYRQRYYAASHLWIVKKVWTGNKEGRQKKTVIYVIFIISTILRINVYCWYCVSGIIFNTMLTVFEHVKTKRCSLTPSSESFTTTKYIVDWRRQKKNPTFKQYLFHRHKYLFSRLYDQLWLNKNRQVINERQYFHAQPIRHIHIYRGKSINCIRNVPEWKWYLLPINIPSTRIVCTQWNQTSVILGKSVAAATTITNQPTRAATPSDQLSKCIIASDIRYLPYRSLHTLIPKFELTKANTHRFSACHHIRSARY